MDSNQNTRNISPKEFVDQLLTEGSKVSCDESNTEFYRNDKLPPFYDEELFKKGQQFFYKHIFSMFATKYMGLLSVLAIPSIRKILIHTQMSGSELTAYKRYMATIFHMMIWYDQDFKPGSRLWKSISEIRNLHNSASKRSCKAGLHRISQRDMTLTQFGFMGFAIARPEYFGINSASNEELRGFLHVWKIVGYLMGIEDRFNLCYGTVEETREACNLLIQRAFQPEIEKKDKDFISMCKYLTNGLWTMNPILQHESSLCALHILVQNSYDDNLKPTYFKLTYIQTFNFNLVKYALYFMKYDWFRIYHNYSQMFSLWLMKVCPFLAYYKFGIKHSTVNIKV